MSDLRPALAAACLTVLLSICAAPRAWSEGAQTILCAISSTYDYPTGKQSGPTTGEDVFTFSAQPDGSIAVGSVVGCTKMTQFIASDSEYFIACDFVIRGMVYKRQYTINRYSGSYQKLFALEGSKDFLLFSGTCEPAKKRF